jgi:hypothetical protein
VLRGGAVAVHRAGAPAAPLPLRPAALRHGRVVRRRRHGGRLRAGEILPLTVFALPARLELKYRGAVGLGYRSTYSVPILLKL